MISILCGELCIAALQKTIRPMSVRGWGAPLASHHQRQVAVRDETRSCNVCPGTSPKMTVGALTPVNLLGQHR
jgi:hypothetical protein